METVSSKQQLLNLALDVVYLSVDKLAQAFAWRFALENMGHCLADHLRSSHTAPERVYYSCWDEMYQNSESDEMAQGLEAERKVWLLEGKKCAEKVANKKLPLTMRNAADAWYERKAFAKSK